MNRRDILKLFGVGAAVMPVVGGVPVSAAQSLIVKPPEIEIPPEPKIVPPFECPAPGAYECTLFMRERRTATVYRMCERGDLGHVRVANAIRVSAASLDAFIRTCSDELSTRSDDGPIA